MGHTSIKMANMSEDYLVGDDLDDLFLLLEGGFLDEDADLNREVDDLVTEVAADEENAEGYKCNSCDKICKSQRGLSRHKNATHKGSDEKLGYPNRVCCGVPRLFERPDIELFSICYTQGTVVAIALQYKHDT